jgi:hypothetical protein
MDVQPTMAQQGRSRNHSAGWVSWASRRRRVGDTCAPHAAGYAICAAGGPGPLAPLAQPFEDHRHPLTTADAHRLQPDLLVVEGK